jgi:putative ABC transport system permease protein
MLFLASIRMAMREIVAHRLRTALTTLGIVIGVSAVVAVVTVMQSVSGQIMEDVSTLGQNMVMVHPKRDNRGGRTVPLETADAEAIARDVRGVTAVAPVAVSELSFSANANTVRVATFGTTNAYLAVRAWPLAAGRIFYPSEEAGGGAFCMLGDTTRRDLFGSQNPIGATIRSGRFACRIIGLLAKRGNSSFTEEIDRAVLMPISTYHRRVTGTNGVDMFFVGTVNGVERGRIVRSIEKLMQERRRAMEGEPATFRVTDVREAMKRAMSIATQLALGVAGLAAISLIVGGIGIMNIMLVSVTERTREIGIRLAVGARSPDILLQFLIEAVVLSVAGGLAGIALGLAVSGGLSAAIGVPFQVSAEVLAFGFGVPAAIGIAFGFFPALRASRLDPIEALRYE